MKRLLITGASGFLGSRIKEFYQKDYDIYAPSHQELDITDEKNVLGRFREWQPDFVIHCAAISDVGSCEKEPELSWKINVDGAIHIAKASQSYGAKCLICSSDQVYFGSTISGPHEETEEVTPVNLYGREKQKAEEVCLKINPECVLLRLSWLYDRKTGKENEHGDFFKTLLLRMQENEVLQYPIYDIRGITDVTETVKNLEKAFTLPGGIYNFGSPNEKNTYETVLKVFKTLLLGTERLQQNKEAFAANKRDISMSQKKINAYGIVFSSTEDGMLRNLRSVMTPGDNRCK